jgi:hypothetical protein
MTYLKYLRYVLRHKWFVFVECCKLGIPWLGLVHDWSKFLPSEFIPYARHFYGGKHDIKRDSTGYYKPIDTGDLAFDWAWFLHSKRNRHHWQWWVLPEGDPAEDKVLRMPLRYMKEMLADWRGAGRALGTPNTRAWFYAHVKDMRLGIDARIWLMRQLEGGQADQTGVEIAEPRSSKEQA